MTLISKFTPLNDKLENKLRQLYEKPQQVVKRGKRVNPLDMPDNRGYFRGKLKAHDVDMIKYLQHRRLVGRKIAEYYDIHIANVSRITGRHTFDRYVSPFERVINGVYVVTDPQAIMQWGEEHKEEVDLILLLVDGKFK